MLSYWNLLLASLSRLLEPSLGATFWMNLLELRASSWTSPAGSLSHLLEPPLGDTSKTHLLKPPLGSASWSRLFDGDGLPVRCAHREIGTPELKNLLFARNNKRFNGQIDRGGSQEYGH